MALKPRHPDQSLTPPPTLAGPFFEHCRTLLVFTLADRRTVGFPLSWLYQYDYRRGEEADTFTLVLTEHRITVAGLHLGAMEDRLQEGEGFRAKELPARYQGTLRPGEPHISRITIEPPAATRTLLCSASVNAAASCTV